MMKPIENRHLLTFLDLIMVLNKNATGTCTMYLYGVWIEIKAPHICLFFPSLSKAELN